MAVTKGSSPPEAVLWLLSSVLVSLLIIMATVQNGAELKTVAPSFESLIKGLTVISAVLTAILFTVGHVYQWNFVLQLGLPPDLFTRARDEVLVQAAITIVSCFKSLRIAYLSPLLGFAVYLWAQWHYKRSLGDLTIPVNAAWFLIAFWVLLRGVGKFPPYDIHRLEEHSQGQCFRLHTLQIIRTRENGDKFKESIECFLVRCNEKAIVNPISRELSILKRDDVCQIDVHEMSRPEHPDGFFWRPLR